MLAIGLTMLNTAGISTRVSLLQNNPNARNYLLSVCLCHNKHVALIKYLPNFIDI